MKGCASHDATRRGRSPLPAYFGVALLLFTLPISAHAAPWGSHGGHRGPHPGMQAHGHAMQHAPRQTLEHGRDMRPPQERLGHERLPQWFRSHQHLTPQEQERALRRQPGFNRLSHAQQRRILHRLRVLDAQPPAVRARMMARNEAFEHLSPQRRQEVRAAAQAFRHMPPARKRQMGRAFNILRTLPPRDRADVLNSARFRAEYSPRERHILSNLLSIEPWEPPPPPLPRR